MVIKPIKKNNLSDAKVHLSYRDILLVPFDVSFCEIKSRNDPDISSEICLGKKIKVPFLSAPMDTVTGSEMCLALDQCGALGVHTRYINDPDEKHKQLSAIKWLKERVSGHICCAIGVKNNTYDHVSELCDAGLDIICLDIANGNHIYVHEALRSIKPLKERYGLSIIAGNVATGMAAARLFEAGACTVKVGIGAGAACITRRVLGYGVPQLTAILDCAEYRYKLNLSDMRIISDGGIRHGSDITKAIWAGADTVMLGYVFAGHDECPLIDGERQYRGMASRTVSKRDDVAAEGVNIKISSKGPVKNTVDDLAAALRASCSFGNASNLHELRSNVQAIRVSTMTNEESDPVAGEI